MDDERLELFIQKFTSQRDYPCIICDRKYIKNAKMTKTKGDGHALVGGRIDCLCDKIGVWNRALAEEINDNT